MNTLNSIRELLVIALIVFAVIFAVRKRKKKAIDEEVADADDDFMPSEKELRLARDIMYYGIDRVYYECKLKAYISRNVPNVASIEILRYQPREAWSQYAFVQITTKDGCSWEQKVHYVDVMNNNSFFGKTVSRNKMKPAKEFLKSRYDDIKRLMEEAKAQGKLSFELNFGDYVKGMEDTEKELFKTDLKDRLERDCFYVLPTKSDVYILNFQDK